MPRVQRVRPIFTNAILSTTIESRDLWACCNQLAQWQVISHTTALLGGAISLSKMFTYAHALRLAAERCCSPWSILTLSVANIYDPILNEQHNTFGTVAHLALAKIVFWATQTLMRIHWIFSRTCNYYDFTTPTTCKFCSICYRLTVTWRGA